MYLHNRIDCILIWGHGMQYFDNILSDIRENKSFKILKIQKHIPKDMKKFVREMYSYDYAPFWHLKAKTEYLLHTSNEVCFIFINNLNPDEDYFGEGSFRHKESLTLKIFKENLRDKYNPYQNGKRTHNHVIHTTDSSEQTHHILQYLGYNNGINIFNKSSKIIELPYYLKGYSSFKFMTIEINKLFCNTIIGDSWNNYSVQTIKIKESPQYLGLTKNMNIYMNYINKYLGGPLQEDYNLDRYVSLSKNFKYLETPYESSFIVVEKKDNKYIILDGLHRTCTLMVQKQKEIKVCQILK